MFSFWISEPTYFDVNFDPGEKIINSSKSLDSITKIRFTCSENATWENSKDGKVPQLAHVQVNAAIKPELLAVEVKDLDFYIVLDLFSVVPSSTPRPHYVNSQLVSLLPVGILNSLCYIYNIWLFI